jgi:hypothetical protein
MDKIKAPSVEPRIYAGMGETAQLVAKLNRSSSQHGVLFSIEDLLGNGKPTFVMSGGEHLRKRVSEIAKSGDDLLQINRMLAAEVAGVQAIEPRTKYKDQEHCFQWMCRTLYGRVDSTLDADSLNFNLIGQPEIGAAVAYFKANSQGCAERTHFGVVVDVEKQVVVDSKWGNGHVYRHLLPLVPNSYGNALYFLKVVGATVEAD